MFVSRLGEHLGLELRSLACLENGGCSSALALRWAIYEVASGRCDAAVALGMIGTPGARAALEKGLRDRDPVVSNAARKALRGDG